MGNPPASLLPSPKLFKRGWEYDKPAHLLFGDIDGFINYYPDGALPAARMRGGTLIGDIMIRIG